MSRYRLRYQGTFGAMLLTPRHADILEEEDR